MLTRKLPWNERNGRFSPLKAVVFAALFLPALWILYQLRDRRAGSPSRSPRLIHRTGDWAVRLILVSLLITPLRKLAQWPKLIAVRRMVGVAGFAYAFAHFCLYIVDQHYDLLHVAAEIVLRFYLTIGFVALLGLGALTATSTDAMIRRLGAARWNLLHKSIYLLGALALFHYYLQSKADVSDPVLMTGLFLMLMLYRALVKRLPLWAASVAAVVVGTGLTRCWRRPGTRSAATIRSGTCSAPISTPTCFRAPPSMSRSPAWSRSRSCSCATTSRASRLAAAE